MNNNANLFGNAYMQGQFQNTTGIESAKNALSSTASVLATLIGPEQTVSILSQVIGDISRLHPAHNLHAAQPDGMSQSYGDGQYAGGGYQNPANNPLSLYLKIPGVYDRVLNVEYSAVTSSLLVTTQCEGTIGVPCLEMNVENPSTFVLQIPEMGRIRTPAQSYAMPPFPGIAAVLGQQIGRDLRNLPMWGPTGETVVGIGHQNTGDEMKIFIALSKSGKIFTLPGVLIETATRNGDQVVLFSPLSGRSEMSVEVRDAVRNCAFPQAVSAEARHVNHGLASFIREIDPSVLKTQKPSAVAVPTYTDEQWAELKYIPTLMFIYAEDVLRRVYAVIMETDDRVTIVTNQKESFTVQLQNLNIDEHTLGLNTLFLSPEVGNLREFLSREPDDQQFIRDLFVVPNQDAAK